MVLHVKPSQFDHGSQKPQKDEKKYNKQNPTRVVGNAR